MGNAMLSNDTTLDRNDRFYILDLRAKERFVLDNAFFNGYVKILGTNALGVYCSLCRHADKKQKSFPSVKLLSVELNIHRTTVIDCIKALELFNIIKKVRVGKMCTNRYYLLDKKYWVRTDDEILMSPLATSLENGEVGSRYFRGLLTRLQRSVDATSSRKETQKKGKTKETVKEFEKNEKQLSPEERDRRMTEIKALIGSWNPTMKR